MRLVFLCFLVPSLALAQGDPGLTQDEVEPDVPSRLTAPPLAKALPILAQDDLLTFAVKGPDGKLGLTRDGGLDTLTIDTELQKQLTDTLKLYQTPWAAVVAIEPSTGRVLAMAEHSEADPSMRGLCTRALYPAASIFKVVTAAALLEAGVSPDEVTCIHGGKRTVDARQLEDTPADTRCLTVAEAMGASANVAFAKLTARYLDPERLKATSRAFHFNTPLAFPVPAGESLAAIPPETYELSLTGAGFGDVFLSPLHGAALAATVANHGAWRAPVLFDKDVAAGQGERVVPVEIADQLASMMELTVTSGTARRIFHEPGHGVPSAVGKTGSLADKRPFRDYSWFIGYAPKENPKIAVAAVIVNDPHWRIRATWLGREALRLFLSRPARSMAAASP